MPPRQTMSPESEQETSGSALSTKRVCSKKADAGSSAPLLASLESLPPDVLDIIFENVMQADLLNLCWISRDLYWPAVKHIYRNLVCDAEHLYLSNVRQCQDDWEVYYGTVVALILKLNQTLKSSSKLASFVKSVSLHPLRESDQGKELCSLTPCITEYYGCYDACFPSQYSVQLMNVICNAKCRPSFTNSLVKLTLIDPIADGPYREIAQNMIRLKSYENLKSLCFQKDICYDISGYFVHGFLDNHFHVGWLSFLSEFHNSKIKLKLSCLGIHSPVARSTELSQIQKAVDWKNLKELALTYHDIERSTEEEEEEEYDLADIAYSGPTFLEKITKKTTLLERLIVQPVAIEQMTGVTAICNTLKQNLPNQLKELCVVLEAEREEIDDYGYCEIIKQLQESVICSQKNLVKLSLHGFYPLLELFGVLALECDRVLFMGDMRQSFPLALRSIHSRVDLLLRCKDNFETERKRLLEVLGVDKVILNAKEYMPKLAQYYISGIFVDMSQMAVLVNEEAILLEQVATEGNCDAGGEVEPDACSAVELKFSEAENDVLLE